MAQRAPSETSILVQLGRVLPGADQATTGGDMDVRAQATLAILIDCATKVDLEKASSVSADPVTCPNCGIAPGSKGSPYCSDCCREQAAFVRQLRGNLQTEAILTDTPRQVSKGEVFWRLLGGGLPRRLAQVPEKARQRVFKRDGGICQECGAPATTIDNTGSG